MTNFKGSKICGKCSVEKLFIEFSRNKLGKYGLASTCKECYKEYRENNKEKINEDKKKYRENNKEKIKEYHKEYRKNNKEYRKNNKEYHKEYRENNKEKIKEYRKEYRKDNKEKIKDDEKKYRENNKDKKNEYFKKRKLNDPLFKFKCSLRSLISSSIRNKGYKKNSKTFDILGCEYSLFLKYMKGQFKDGMTWENHGEWHIDHIMPMHTAQTEEEALALNHYTNLQPLWAEENLSKSNTIIVKQLKFL